MNVMLDLLGALIISSVLLLMMMTFQFQLNDIANRTIFASQMIDHVEEANAKLNYILGMAGIGMVPDSTFVDAGLTSLTFRTYWDYENNSISSLPKSITLRLSTSTTGVGKELVIKQDGRNVSDLGYILWLEDLQFAYYNKTDGVVAIPTTSTTRKTIRCVDVMMTFRRDPPRVGAIPLRFKTQIKCYLMNCYLRGA